MNIVVFSAGTNRLTSLVYSEGTLKNNKAFGHVNKLYSISAWLPCRRVWGQTSRLQTCTPPKKVNESVGFPPLSHAWSFGVDACELPETCAKSTVYKEERFCPRKLMFSLSSFYYSSASDFHRLETLTVTFPTWFQLSEFAKFISKVDAGLLKLFLLQDMLPSCETDRRLLLQI